MRRALSFLVPTSLLLLATFACEDDPTGASGAGNFDAGGFSDATPFVTAEAGPTDPVDAAPEAAAAQVVTIRAIDNVGPKAGIRVVFHDATGAVIETKLTGMDGKATSSTPALPAMATALLDDGEKRHALTWTALEAGDELVVRNLDVLTDSPVGSYVVTAPVYPSAGSFSVQAGGGCNGSLDSTGAGAISMYPRCGAPKVTVLATALLSGTVAAHAFKKGADVPTDGGAAAVTLGAWNIPTPVRVGASPIDDDGMAAVELMEVVDGRSYNADYGYAQPATPWEFRTVTGLADKLQATVHAANENSSSARMLVQVGAPSATVDFDLAQLLGKITDVTVDTTTGARPGIEWTGSTEGTKGGVAQFQYVGGTDRRSYRWSFVVPAGATKVNMPALPPEAAGYLPSASANVRNPEIMFVDHAALTPALLRRQLGAIPGVTAGVGYLSEKPLPIDGLYRLTGYRYFD